MKRQMVLAAAVGATAAAFCSVDVEKDVWFLADFDRPASLSGELFLQELAPEGSCAGRFGQGYHFFAPTGNNLPPMAEFLPASTNFTGKGLSYADGVLKFAGGTFAVAPRPTKMGYSWVASDVACTWSFYVKGAKGTKLTLSPKLSEVTAEDVADVQKKHANWKYTPEKAVKDAPKDGSYELTGDWQRVSAYIVCDNRMTHRRKASLEVTASGPVEMKRFQQQGTGYYPNRFRFDPGIWVDGGESLKVRALTCNDRNRLASFPFKAGACTFWVKNAPDVPLKSPVNVWSFTTPWASQWGLNAGGMFCGEGCNQFIPTVPRRAEWTHVAMVWSPQGVVYYVNGEEKARKTPKAGEPFDFKPIDVEKAVFRFGCFGEGGGAADAVFDEFAVFSRALSAAEVGELVAAKAALRATASPVMAEEPFFRTFYRNEKAAAAYLKVWTAEAGAFTLESEFAGAKLPSRPVALKGGVEELALPFDPAQVRPGRHPLAYRLVGKDGRVALARRFDVEVRGRLEADEFLFHSWGGAKTVSHAYGDLLGINCYCVNADDRIDIRKTVEHGAHPNLRYENGEEWRKQDFDWAGIRAKARKDLWAYRNLFPWVSTLLNSEIYGAETAKRAKDNPKYRAIARKALGHEPEFTFGTAPAEVGWKTLGRRPPRGIIDHAESPTLETLNWGAGKGMPSILSNYETTDEIHRLKPGMTVWSEPAGASVADSVDMGADWLYQCSTATTLYELRQQAAGALSVGKPYMPTLGGCFWPEVHGTHPTLKTKDGKPVRMQMAQGEDEVLVKTWLCLGAVPAHHLSFFGIDAWEWGRKDGRKFIESPTNAVGWIIAEPNVGEKYGRVWREEIAPAANLLRDVPVARADVVLAVPVEAYHAGGFWWGSAHYGHAIKRALADQPVAFDVCTAFTAENLSKYKYVVSIMGNVLYREHYEALRDASAKGATIVTDGYAFTNYPHQVALKGLTYVPNGYEKMRREFLGWYTNVVPELKKAAPAISTCDGGRGFTFLREYKGAKYVVVVNDARDPKPSFLNTFCTNASFRVVGAPQRIETEIRDVPKKSEIYLFNARGRRFDDDTRGGTRLLTADYAAAEGRVYCVYPCELDDPELSLEGEPKAGKTATLVVKINDEKGRPAPGRQIVRLTLKDAEGVERDESGLYTVEDGVARIPLRFARDERPTGFLKKWTAAVEDLTTGNEETLKISLD